MSSLSLKSMKSVKNKSMTLHELMDMFPIPKPTKSKTTLLVFFTDIEKRIESHPDDASIPRPVNKTGNLKTTTKNNIKCDDEEYPIDRFMRIYQDMKQTRKPNKNRKNGDWKFNSLMKRIIHSLLLAHPTSAFMAAHKDPSNVDIIFNDKEYWKKDNFSQSIKDGILSSQLELCPEMYCVFLNHPSILEVIVNKYPKVILEPVGSMVDDDGGGDDEAWCRVDLLVHDITDLPIHHASKNMKKGTSWRQLIESILQTSERLRQQQSTSSDVVETPPTHQYGGIMVKNRRGVTCMDLMIYGCKFVEHSLLDWLICLMQSYACNLLRKDDFDADSEKEKNQEIPILHASMELQCTESTVRFIMRKWPKTINQLDYLGRTSLSIAASKPMYSGELIRVLMLQNDVCPTTLNNNNNNPTIKKPPRPMASIPDHLGRYPLHHALASGRKKMSWLAFQCLVEPSPEIIHIRDAETGLFPFMLAAVDGKNSVDVIYVLLRNSLIALVTN